MRLLRPTAVLFYYDGVQVFEGKDSIGGHYVGLLIDPCEEPPRYVLAGVEPERLWQFKSGKMDLRTLLVEREDERCFIAFPRGDFSEPMVFSVHDMPLVETPWLPEAGFLLHDTEVDSHVVAEARGRNNLVLEVELDPPESIHGHRIRAETLSRLLSGLQTLVHHAYGYAYRELPSQIQGRIDRSRASLLDVVVPAAPGSFKIMVESSQRPGLFGQSELTRALEKVDRLLDFVDDPAATLARVQECKGHFAAAYLRLLRLLVNVESGIRYSWAEPSFLKPRSRSVSSTQAQPIVAALEAVANLGVESVHLVGSLKKADVDNGAWRIETVDREVAGRTRPDGPSLAGLKIEGRYHFTCEEVLEEIQGTGREQRTLYLLQHEPESTG